MNVELIQVLAYLWFHIFSTCSPKELTYSFAPKFLQLSDYNIPPQIRGNICSSFSLLHFIVFQGTEVVPSNLRSHTCLLSGIFIGNVKVLARLSFGLDASREVAMKLVVRSDDEAVSDLIHEIISSG